ncbi:MAG TPA: SRPBCC family protein [Thermomicrobiaceae bacterium]|nr:SRPBCC family protein [Thermomicrobiaceae bacterium]
MPQIQKTATINAPIERVFEAIDDPEMMPRYVPSVTKVSDIHRTDERLRDTFRVTYEMLGIHFDQLFTYTEYDRPRRITARFTGPMTGTMSCRLEPHGDSTLATVEIDYQMPGGVLGKAADRLVAERMNERTAEHMLENIKALVESQGAPPPSNG